MVSIFIFIFLGSTWFKAVFICQGRSISRKGTSPVFFFSQCSLLQKMYFYTLLIFNHAAADNFPHHFLMQKAPIDPFTKESCKPSASQGVPLGGMG